MAALNDFLESLLAWRIWVFLSWGDIAKRYRRSLIGPFWLTLSISILIVSLGFIYSQIFGMEVRNYLPYLTAGHLIFGFMSGAQNDATTAYVQAEAYLKHMKIPKATFILQCVSRNLIIFAHHTVLYLGIAIYYGLGPSETLWMLPVSLGITIIFVFFTCLGIAVLCIRYRDLIQIVASFLQVVYFLTPVLWRFEQLGEDAQRLLFYNPFAIFVELNRGILFGTPLDERLWLYAVGYTAIAAIVAIPIFATYRSRIVYWL